nr:tRNA-dihydrouridine synthase family protein [uncultured Treponema sp.]
MIKLIAGPMATLSHQGLRKIIEGFGGCDEYYTEMINAASFLTHGKFESFYALNETAADKIVWQLTGKDSTPMAEAALELCSLGGIGIDINMGCSAPEIYKTGAGISWMIRPREETRDMICAVRDKVKLRLSAKIRLGDEDFTDDGFYSFCRMLYDCGIEQLVIHPRTKKEKLARPPRYFYVENVAREFLGKMNVVLNGNVKDVSSFNAALSAAPSVSAVMIARMSAQKPWIFAKLKRAMGEGASPEQNSAFIQSAENAPLKIDRLKVGLEYIQNLRTDQPPEFWITRMQRFFAYYCDNFSYGHYIKSKMLNCKTLEDAERTFTSYFDEVPDDRWENLI